MAIILTKVDAMLECGRENINKRINIADNAIQEHTPIVESQKSPMVADMFGIFTINKYIKILNMSLICWLSKYLALVLALKLALELELL